MLLCLNDSETRPHTRYRLRHGVFLEKAVSAGFDAIGIDAAPEMVSIAANRVGKDRVRTERMQDLDETHAYDGIVSLSWSFNYVLSYPEARDILERLFQALRPEGRLILQIAHAPNASGALGEDREPGPDGQEDDVVFLYRFSSVPEHPGVLHAQYVYGCKSIGELFFEEHRLGAADANEVAALASMIGFEDIELLDFVARRTLQEFGQRFPARSPPAEIGPQGPGSGRCSFLTKLSCACRLAPVPSTVCSVRSWRLNQL